MKNSSILRIITLNVILVVTLVTRLWSLSTFPPALFSDEVDAGYQAMVFNNQGTDYHGNKFPTHFQSFSDWRTPAYIYAIALIQKLGVPPEASVRLPSAIFGIATVYLIYLITNSPLAAFLFSISPWAIHYSRTGFEVSGMIMVILAGIYFFQRYIHTLLFKYLLISTFFLALSPYFYSTAKLFLPFILLLLFTIWFRHFIKFPRHALFSIIFLLILQTPIIFDTIKGHSGFRFSYIGIFTQPHREQVTDQLRYEDILLNHPGEVGVRTPFLSFLLHNKYQLVFEKFITNYFSSFSGNFLFVAGDNNLRHGFGGHGVLYYLDSIFILIGLFIFFRKPDKLGILFFYILILAPIPFALTRDSNGPHATRLILMLPSIIYFVRLGIGRRYYLLPLYLLSFVNFYHYYLFHYPQVSANTWHSNLKEAIIATNNYPGSKLFFSNSYEPALPFFLFYKQYLPQKPSTLVSSLSAIQNEYFDGTTLQNSNYFGHINWNSVPADPSLIFVLPSTEFSTISKPSSFTILQKIPKPYLSAPEFYLISPNQI